MRKAEGGGYNASPSLVSKLSGSRGNSAPLPASTRKFMEGAFSTDFSRVRVHTDSEAASMSKGINAKAFTHGSDVYFNNGEYSPETQAGQNLLVHELTHVVQQSNGSSSGVVQRQGIDGKSGATCSPKPVPTSTPGSCQGRHDGYAAAHQAYPGNAWLRCVDVSSGQICQAIDAFHFKGLHGTELQLCAKTFGGDMGRINAKADWFNSTNACIWGHWRAAMDSLNDSGCAIPSGLTPEWIQAVNICRIKGAESKECCREQIVAEQKAIDICGPYDSHRFGRWPTDVPGSPYCSQKVRENAPPGPPFSGDFGNVNDRIAYGNKRCCS